MRLNRSLLFTAALLTALSCHEKPTPEPEPDPTPDPQPEVTVPAFAKGADISWASEMEKSRTFKKKDGTAADILDVLKETGVNAIRLRVWLDPYGGWSGKDDVVKMAERSWKAGLPLMVDFHYSDFFADPSRQRPPSAWEADKADVAKMADHVKAHTTDVLQALKDAGVTPAWVQIGNETRNGMLHPAGQLWNDSGDISGGRANFARLFNAGYDAAKAVFPDIIVMPHLNNAYDDNAWWFEQVKAAGGRFDAIALSHYPQAESKFTWQQYNDKAVSQVKALIAEFQLPVYIAEVGVKTPAGETLAAQVLSDFMTQIQKIDKCAGVFYWEPEVDGSWKPAVYGNSDAIYQYTGKKETWNAYGMGAFSKDGKVTSVMDAFK